MTGSELAGRVALVTGANNPEGIGAGIARELVRAGARVFLTYLRAPVERFGLDPERSAAATEPGEERYRRGNALDIGAILEELRALGGAVEAWEADLALPETPAELMDRAEAAHGPVEVLVNNAAYCVGDSFLPDSARSGNHDIARSPIHALTAQSLDAHWAVNARAPALLTGELARRHIARGARWGRVVNVSTDGAPCFPGEVSYGASKYALESLGRSAAAELGPHGITVNTVSLGPIQTGWITRELEERVARHTPLGRVGEPSDVADVVAFLCTDAARWVSGQVIYIGGGHRMV